ncbi:MAG: hypothetical protein ACAH10_11685 [Methylophilaceae bacterium]
MTSLSEKLRLGGDFELGREVFQGPAQAKGYTNFLAPYSIYLDTGRSALLVIAIAIKQMGGTGKVWLPAYGCESISQAFLQAGYQIEYYSVGIDLLGIPSAMPKAVLGDTVLFIHYFGHLNKMMLKHTPLYREEGVWVIEDFVQAGLMKAPLMSGDFAITSYRKLLSSPDGAILASKIPIDNLTKAVDIAPSDEAFVSAKVVAKIIRANNGNAKDFLSLIESAEGSLSNSIVPRHMSWLSQWIVSRLDISFIAAKRRENWIALFAELQQLRLKGFITPLFGFLDEVEVPLGMPVKVMNGKRDALRDYLVQRNIFCPIHWDMSFLPNKKQFLVEVQLSSSLLTLPIDQRMTSEHIQHMMDSMMGFFRE